MVESTESTGLESISPEELSENALMLVQQLHAEGQIDDEERDSLKGKSGISQGTVK